MRHIIPVLTCLLLTACGSSVPLIDVETRDEINPIWHVAYVQVKVKAITEEITIADIQVNRGNCTSKNRDFFTQKPILPKTLKFGESVTMTFSAPCEASQVDVTTDKGDWSFNY